MTVEQGRASAPQVARPTGPARSVAYLDHAATTPMLDEVVAEYTEALQRTGNASSLHGSGRRARQVVEESRERVAQALGARPSEVVFTAGGTESDNLAVKGLYWSRRAADPRRRRVLASGVEHHAVLDAVAWLVEHEDAQVQWLPVDGAGRVHPTALAQAIEAAPDEVALVTTMWVNNEVGTVQPVAELAEVAHEHGIVLHTDAVQAVGQVPVHFGESRVDALTLTGHKLGGPLGVGALLVGRQVAVMPLLHGGGQERDIRSGTLDTPGVAAFAFAVELAVAGRVAKAARLALLRDDLVHRVQALVPDAILNGPPLHDPTGAAALLRQPSNAHLSFPGCEGDALLMLLDAQGVECSTGSACSAGVARPSHVLLAMGADVDLARASLRFTLGHTSTTDDVDRLVGAIGPAVARARRARG